MMNITVRDPVFNVKGKELDKCVRDALDKAATAITEMYGMQSVDLNLVTTKTHTKLVFVKYVRQTILAKKGAKFDEDYVQTAFDAYSAMRGGMSEAIFYKLTLADPNGPHTYRPTYRATIELGMGIALVVLHCSGAITLPYSFNWPFAKHPTSSFIEIAPLVGSELVQLVRSAGDENSPHADALATVATDTRRRLWFVSAGTKLLLMTGWNEPEDVNLDDLLAIKQARDAADPAGRGSGMAYRALVDVLERKYGKRVAVSVRAWDDALRSADRLAQHTRRRLDSQQTENGVAEPLSMRATDASPERLSKLDSLPGLKLDLQALSKGWRQPEELYLAKLRRENTKNHVRALGHWNLYLFFYLPYWFEQQPTTKLRFPSTPSELLASIFVSRLVPQDFEVPQTFLEFLGRYSKQRGWKSEVEYATLKSLEQFFEFLEQRADELPGCKGFTQPLSKFDFPKVARSGGTNKRPIPRRIFAFYLSYIEALLTYSQVVLAKILTGEIGSNELDAFLPKRNVIDTVRVSGIVGYIPVVFFRGKLHKLQFIPNCIDLESFRLKDGRTLRIPQPHGLHHVLVAAYTGIRNNHIQWLDARTFDSKVHPDDGEFTTLWVNTDKVKAKGWGPHVNIRVIQVLRQQAQWRALIDCGGFAQEVHYQRNPKTKWPPILPLFSCQADGYPHPDTRYTETWNSVLLGVQGMLRELGMEGLSSLCELMPSDVPYGAPDKLALLNRYRDSTERVLLEPKSNITPHSARVGVVSHLIHVLPADIIGKYITGQHEAVVYHYVYIDEEETLAAQQLQAVELHMKAYGREFEALTSSRPRDNRRFVKADEVNSRFSRALKENLEETLASYGCVSLTLTEEGKTGIDVLRETRGTNAAFNKTEVCPFGNHCPPDVLKNLRGVARCAMCPYAVRSVDHLPAVVAKTKQVTEQLEAIEAKLDAEDLLERYSDTEQQQLEAERQRIGDELTAWKLVGEVLETQRQRIALGQDSRRWVVPKPEVIEQALRRVAVPSNETAYVLARLAESVAYPTFDSPEITAKFDLLRRQLLANVGNVRAALTSPIPPDVAAQCVGLLRTVVDAHGLKYEQVLTMLGSNAHLASLPALEAPLLLERS